MATAATATTASKSPPPPTTIHVRDSKHPEGPRLTAIPTAWAAFVALVRRS
ncbi:DUF397 domain-containing protein [Streptomyces sp. NPDC005890]|uniref:DUF397 domain-containing protein n=1 Tax=Streptomyces sp. NPDC005890 TaxID=3154568 RepID=UPI0033F91DDC